MSPAEIQCRLTYSELQALSLRIDELAGSIMNPGHRADLAQACRAISDLSSLRFAVSEIAASIHDATTADELRALIGALED
jgi:hypothetical protein